MDQGVEVKSLEACGTWSEFWKRKIKEWLEQYLNIWDVSCKSVFPG